MTRTRKWSTFWPLICAGLLGLLACQPGQEIIVPDNNAVPYDGVATIKLENYINRLFIDLLGREPLDVEMEAEVLNLRADSLSLEARQNLIVKIMEDQTVREGDSTYQIAYYLRLYELAKARLIEGSSDEEIRRVIGIQYQQLLVDSLNMNWAGVEYWKEKIGRMQAILDSQHEYRQGLINIDEMYARLLFNDIYDVINMNSINFIRSCFDNLFFRFPTQAEFDASFPIIENNIASTIFGQSASNKQEYIDIMVNSREFHEGMIRWAYTTLLAREATSAELKKALDEFYIDRDFQKVQINILTTEEYANF